jgi:LysM repeat protein
VDAEQTKGRTWNGYVCPGCRTIFRVAADFIGAEVMCPSCKETLRLPKTPEEVRPHTVSPEKPAAAAPVDPVQDTHPPVRRASHAATNGRTKLTRALLLISLLAAGVLLFLIQKKSGPEKTTPSPAPPITLETTATEKPAPLPPPVAVSEMPEPAPPALPESEDTPDPEIAVVQPVPEPEAPVVGISNGLVVAAAEPAPPDAGLVEAIPATTVPEQSAPAAPPEPAPAAAPVQRVHTVVRGDTLNKIARKYQISIATLKEANGMKNDVVRLGGKLVIPPAKP